MNKNLYILIGIMLALGIISAIITYFRADKMSPVADIATKGLAAVRQGNIIFFGAFIPLLFGPISYFIYRSLLTRSPDTAQTSFLLLAIGAAIVLTVLAAVVFKMRGFAEFLILHILYTVGLGWLMPRLFV